MLKISFGNSKNQLRLGSAFISCYILENKQHVITKDSLQKALGYDGKSENWLFEFLTIINKFIPIYSELVVALKNPLLVTLEEIESQNSVIEVLDSKLLFETFNAIIKAKNEGFLNVNQLKHAKAATLLLENIGASNINDLIDKATRFLWYKETSLEKLILFLQEQENDSAFIWIKTIPSDFIELLLEMNTLKWIDVYHKPYLLGKLLHETIFLRLENTVLDDIRNSKPKRNYTRKENKKQDIEHPKLKEYIIALQSLIKASGNNWNIFIQLLNKTYPKQKNRTTLHFYDVTEKINKPLSGFNEKLKNSFNK